MRFDDRLRTVLAQPAADPHDRAVRWRQLVELAARASPESDGGLLQQAVEAIRADSALVDERVRVAAALAIAPLNLPVDLVAAFAADRLNVAAPILAGARLSASEWNRVAAEASEECRAFISTMRPGQPQPGGGPTAPAEPPPGEDSRPIPSISEVVARIERIRSSREAGEAAASATEVPGSASSLFRWECNESGEIDWVEGAPRGALVGHSIAQRGIAGGVDGIVERAFASRAPFHGGLLELPRDTTVGGTWKISGVPAFDRANGRFHGYRGIAERSGGTDGQAAAGLPADSTSLRELAHEIRTPLNAIIGFAEIISGEHLGPAESRYRERADEIVAQARLLLSAVEDLDFAARLHAPDRREEDRVDLGQLVERMIAGIREAASVRGVEVDASRSTTGVIAAVSPEVAERLVDRLCSAVIGRASEGERLQLSLDSEPRHCTISITRPESLKGADLRPERSRRASDAATLPLRLVIGLARTAGGEVDTAGDRLTLRLPKA